MTLDTMMLKIFLTYLQGLSQTLADFFEVRVLFLSKIAGVYNSQIKLLQHNFEKTNKRTSKTPGHPEHTKLGHL